MSSLAGRQYEVAVMITPYQSTNAQCEATLLCEPHSLVKSISISCATLSAFPSNDRAVSTQVVTMALVNLHEAEIQRIFDSQGQNEVQSLYYSMKLGGKHASKLLKVHG
jgi:hypothetical protein